ncbi:MAG: carboxylating nicotinate-nucleotide diphosphorylase [Woeseiaceae bacterium]|nr:carboxylating nicotinate-nucleotide diphosphorylase [Woeseiaceae bacterium]
MSAPDPATRLQAAIRDNVAAALAEDLGSGDLTVRLLDADVEARARIVGREPFVLAGRPWAERVFAELDPELQMQWRFDDGDAIATNDTICELRGRARPMLSGERTALNFLQTLSATATVTREYVTAVSHTPARILDTRKTLPGLRTAQKYAVRCGGGRNHRHGLYDAILIKENHVAAAGGIANAVARARAIDDSVLLEVEVETLEQLREALAAGVRRILLDNFSLGDLAEAVVLNRSEGRPPAVLEASGGLAVGELKGVAETGVDYVSVGALTKHVHAADLSMLFD